MQRYLVLLAGFFGVVGVHAQGFYPSAPSSSPNNSINLVNLTRINTADLEFSPALYGNGLVYVSRFKNGPVDPKSGETYLQLFYTDLDALGMPGKPRLFSQQLTSSFNEGPVCFTRKGDRVFFTRTNSQAGVSKKNKQGDSVLKIYEARKGPFDWEDIHDLPFNNDDYSCMHPALSPDGHRLFFTSNMPGGYGGFDLYFVENRGGSWSEPINLGPEINTSRNEAFPFLHESGMLFFASNGHSGVGGIDLFMIDISGRQWGQIINLGAPFNSAEDDFGLVVTPNGEHGYFTSSRSGGMGRDDIYLFEAPRGIQGIELPRQRTEIATVYDGNSSRQMSGVSLRLYELSTDGTTVNDELYNVELLPDLAGGDDMVMKLVRKREEDLGAPLTLTDRRGEGLIPVQENQEYLLLVSKPGFFTQEIQFKATQQGLSRPLEVILQPNNCVSLGGYVRAERFNIGVAGAWVTVVNNCDQSRERIRTNVNGYFETCISLGCDFTITGEKEGYSPGRSAVSTTNVGASRSLEAELRLVPDDVSVIREPIREGTKIVLENIYYDFNKSDIRSGSASDLEALANLMITYPSMLIELGAHTDSRGDADYNLNLSLRRAESAKEFLVRRGITESRVRAVGYGETEPRNQCVDGVPCTEEQYKANRRTEVKVLKINEDVQVRSDGKGRVIID